MNGLFSFGHADTGFDFGKMQQMVDDFSQVVKENCLDCDYRFLCSRCFIHFAKDSTFKLDGELCRLQEKKFERFDQIIRYVEEGLLDE